MSGVGKPSGLARRKGSASLYYRQRWPKRFQRPGAPAEIWISLGTAVHSEALVRLEDARREAYRRFSEPAPEIRLSGIYSRTVRPSWPLDHLLPELRSDQAMPLAQGLFDETLRAMDAEPPPPSDWGGDDLWSWRTELEMRLARLTGPNPADGIDDMAGAKVAVLRKAGLRADPESEACNLLHNYLRRAMAQACQIELARLQGDFTDRITDKLFDPAAQPSNTVSVAKPPRRSEALLGEVIDRYLVEVLDLRGVTEKTSQKHRSLLNHIASFFDRKTPVCDIERADCTRFRDTLAKLPPNFTKKQKGRARSLAKIAEANADGRTLAWETQNNYLKMMDDLMGWAVKERLVPDNVAHDIPPLKKREAAENQRLPFLSDELASIFAQPIFTGCLDDERGYAKPGPNVIRRSRYWLPLVALFMGMRMGEILQLTTGHIRVSRAGNPFIVLTRDMRLKTDSAEREIPVHPMLQRLGFLDWVDARRQAGKHDLFDDVPDGRHGYRSDTFTKRFATFLKRVNLPAERRPKLCFHSLRHTFKDALNETGAPEGEMEEICGWSRGKKTSRRYGSGISADRLKPYVDQVRFDVDLDHLLPSSMTDQSSRK